MPETGIPAGIDLVSRFVNTLDVETGSDALADPAALCGWLEQEGLLAGGARAGEGDLAQARALREALRALILGNNGGPPDDAAAAILEEAARRARLGLRFHADGRAALEPGAGGVDGALGRLVAAVADAMTVGTWARLKACRAHTCHYAFYDQSRNRSRAWCDMAVCGNREKARSYRQRHSEG